MDKVWAYAAYNLIPKRLAYWCYVRVHSYASVAKFTDKSPDQINCFEAMEAWN